MYPGLLGGIVRDIRLIVGPEPEVLHAARCPVVREPLPLRRRRVVLRLHAVGHRRVPLRLRTPAPAVAVVVLVVVRGPGAVIREGRRRDLRVGIAAPRLALERPSRPETGVAEVVERAEEPELVLGDRPAEREAASPNPSWFRRTALHPRRRRGSPFRTSSLRSG